MRRHDLLIPALLFALLLPGCFNNSMDEILALKEAKEYQKAIEKIKAALVETPKVQLLHYELGECLALTGAHQRAAYYFLECIQNRDGNISEKNELLIKMSAIVSESPEYSKILGDPFLEMVETKKYEDLWANLIVVLGKLKYTKAAERLKELAFYDNIDVRRNIHTALLDITGDDYIY